MDTRNFFPYGINNNNKQYGIFCFHHAGGSAFTFKQWLDFSQTIEIVPVNIRNQESNDIELHFYDIVQKVSELIIENIGTRPMFVYGHSLGALFAFAVTNKLEKEFGYKIKKLFVAGRHAPTEKSDSDYQCAQGQEILYQKLEQEGTIEKKILQSQMFRKFFLPNIFRDYKLNEEYVYSGEIIDIPIVTLSGDKDGEADIKVMKKWENVTAAGITQYEFSGNHFFPYSKSMKKVLEVIALEIEKTWRPAMKSQP